VTTYVYVTLADNSSSYGYNEGML